MVTQTAQYTLPALTYPYDSLEPHIDTETMHLHHDKHHATYVTNLNKALEDAAEAGFYVKQQSIEELISDIDALPEGLRTVVRNNGGGHANHSMFWLLLSPNGGGEPYGAIAEAIDASFGSFENMKSAFNEAATKRFGSGWAWLVIDPSTYKLAIMSTPNQDSPLMKGIIPVLALDVWEHSYYLKYQNRRPEYIAAFWNLVNWDTVNSLCSNAMQ